MRRKRKNYKREENEKGIFDVIYYLALVIILFMILVFACTDGVRTMFGYSFMTVLTSSMQDAIPQGSLIVNKAVNASTLEVGDDITFMTGENITFTHRIVDIETDENGSLWFQTQGIMNKYPDAQLVSEANVVGKVIYHNYELGKMVTFLEKYIVLIIFFGIVLTVLCVVLKKINAPETSLSVELEEEDGQVREENENLKLEDSSRKRRRDRR